jgi:hypothetical protein
MYEVSANAPIAPWGLERHEVAQALSLCLHSPSADPSADGCHCRWKCRRAGGRAVRYISYTRTAHFVLDKDNGCAIILQFNDGEKLRFQDANGTAVPAAGRGTPRLPNGSQIGLSVVHSPPLRWHAPPMTADDSPTLQRPNVLEQGKITKRSRQIGENKPPDGFAYPDKLSLSGKPPTGMKP